jgi:hypothetical protein
VTLHSVWPQRDESLNKPVDCAWGLTLEWNIAAERIPKNCANYQRGLEGIGTLELNLATADLHVRLASHWTYGRGVEGLVQPRSTSAAITMLQ